MAVTVGVNSYGDEAGLQAYADLRGITISGDLSQLLIKAMDWLEIQPLSGHKYVLTQALQFPRSNYDPWEGDVAGVVPDEIIKAQYVAALLIDSGNDLNPVVEQQVKREQVDVIEVEYTENSNPTNIYLELNRLMSRFLKNTGGSFEVIRA